MARRPSTATAATSPRPRKRTVKPRRVCPRPDPGQRVMLLGPDRASEGELLAALLGGDDALERALGVLASLGGLAALEGASPRKIAREAGVGLDAALAITAAIELGRRAVGSSMPYGRTLTGPRDVADFMCASLGAAAQESFMVLGLDARLRLRMARTVAVGSLSTVHVHPREVFRPLVEAGMHSAILAHNHPSGCAEPSDADVICTHRMTRAGELMGIEVLDHVVVTRDAVVSIAGLGFITPRGSHGPTWWTGRAEPTRRRDRARRHEPGEGGSIHG